VANRFYQLTGVYSQQAKGSPAPSVCSRNLIAYADKIESNGTRKLYQMPTNWLRGVTRLDSSGRIVKGLLVEPASTNMSKFSVDPFYWHFNGTNGSSLSATLTTQLNGLADTQCCLKEDTSNGGHFGEVYFFTQIINETYCASVFLKKSNRSWFYWTVQGTVTEVLCWYDVNNGVTGTVTNGLSSGMESWGNGWYRCWATWKATASTSTGVVYPAIATGDTNQVFLGLDQDSMFMWGMQVEQGNYPTSLIVTAAANVTRPADSLRYVGNDGNISTYQGSIEAKVLLPNIDTITDGYLLNINASGSTANSITLYNKADTDVVRTRGISGGVSKYDINGNVDVSDGKMHTIKHYWRVSGAGTLVDGTTDGTPVSSNTVPTGLDRIEIGQDASSATQLNGIIVDVKIFGK
jgi:hypothetical protein